MKLVAMLLLSAIASLLIIIFSRTNTIPKKGIASVPSLQMLLVNQILNPENGENGEGDAIDSSDSIAIDKKT